jgi:hypothetical protein
MCVLIIHDSVRDIVLKKRVRERYCEYVCMMMLMKRIEFFVTRHTLKIWKLSSMLEKDPNERGRKQKE